MSDWPSHLAPPGTGIVKALECVHCGAKLNPRQRKYCAECRSIATREVKSAWQRKPSQMRRIRRWQRLNQERVRTTARNWYRRNREREVKIRRKNGR